MRAYGCKSNNAQQLAVVCKPLHHKSGPPNHQGLELLRCLAIWGSMQMSVWSVLGTGTTPRVVSTEKRTYTAWILYQVWFQEESQICCTWGHRMTGITPKEVRAENRPSTTCTNAACAHDQDSGCSLQGQGVPVRLLEGRVPGSNAGFEGIRGQAGLQVPVHDPAHAPGPKPNPASRPCT